MLLLGLLALRGPAAELRVPHGTGPLEAGAYAALLRHASIQGLPVLASRRVHPEAARAASLVLQRSLGRTPESARVLAEADLRVLLLAHDERLEHVARLFGGGLPEALAAGTRAALVPGPAPWILVSEENLLQFPGDPHGGRCMLGELLAEALAVLGPQGPVPPPPAASSGSWLGASSSPAAPAPRARPPSLPLPAGPCIEDPERLLPLLRSTGRPTYRDEGPGPPPPGLAPHLLPGRAAEAMPTRSPGTSRYTWITFHNLRDEPLEAVWIDFQGGRKRYRTVPARGYHEQQTWAGHAWELQGQGGEVRARFVADEHPGLAEIH